MCTLESPKMWVLFTTCRWSSRGYCHLEDTVSRGGHQRMLTRGRSPEDAHQRTLTRGRSPEDTHQRMLTRGRSPEDAHQRMLTRGRSPEDVHQRTNVYRQRTGNRLLCSLVAKLTQRKQKLAVKIIKLAIVAICLRYVFQTRKQIAWPLSRVSL